jgi:N-acetylmuramoyl-L-alanine amidase
MQQQGQFILMNRDEFKKWMKDTVVTRPISIVQNHHTYLPNYSNFNGTNHFKMMESMKTHHITVSKFSDIAQQLTIFPDGLICTGRDFNKEPAGIYGQNRRAICIENVGNFDRRGDIMTDEQTKSILFTNAVLCFKFSIPITTDHIVYHHWFDLKTGDRHNGANDAVSKSCPGSKFFGGNNVEDANQYFIPRVVKEYNFIAYPLWQVNCAQYLVDHGMSYLRKPDESVNFGQLGFMFNNYFSKEPNIDPIEYLLRKKIIKSYHDPKEKLTMGILGYVLMNMENVTGIKPIDFMMQKGYITTAHPENAPVYVWTFGSVMNNILKQHPLTLPK